MSKALVLLSGGADSCICLYWARRSFETVEALVIDYGQRHAREIECAKFVASEAMVPLTLIRTNVLKEIGDSALLKDGDISQTHRRSNLPASFVPGRNIFFLTIAAAVAYKKDIHHLVGGMCGTDYSGYPDCREEFIDSFEKSLRLGLDDGELWIHTPLMYLTKAESIVLAHDIGALPALANTQTCYEGKYPPCGQCPSCLLRMKGFQEANIKDPLLTRYEKER